MKKFFLFVATMLLATNLMAEDYKLEIAELAITDANAANITGPGISGKVSYDAASHTLSLEDATIDGCIWFHPAWVDDAEFIISVKGECTITNASSGPGIYSQVAHTQIKAVDPIISSLTVTVSNSESAIKCFQSSHLDLELRVFDMTLTAESSKEYAIWAGDVNFSNSIAMLSGANNLPAIKNGKAHLTTNECDIVYYVQDFTFAYADGCRMAIAPEFALTERDIFVNGKRINNFTQDDIFQDGHGFGRFESSPFRIVIENTTSNPIDFIQTGADPLLEFQRPCKLLFKSNTHQIGFNGQIKTSHNLTISGQFVNMMYNNMYEPAIAVAADDDVTITFDKASQFEVGGETYSIRKTSGTGKVTASFIASDVTLMNRIPIDAISFSDCGLVDGMGDPMEEGIGKDWILNPNPGTDHVMQGLVDPNTWDEGGNLYTGEIIPANIRSEVFPLVVLGNSVSAANSDDIFGDGMVSYNPATATLTFADGIDLVSTSHDVPVVEIMNANLNVVFEGKVVHFQANDAPAIRLNGTGHKLTLSGKKIGTSINIKSENMYDVPSIDADNNDVEFNGRSQFYVQLGYFADASVIKASNLVINSQMTIQNNFPTPAYDALEIANIITLNSKLHPKSTSEVELVDGKLKWKTSSSEKIVYVWFDPDYFDLSIQGIPVTSLSNEDFYGDGTVKVEQEGTTVTVTLTNANIKLTDGSFAIFCNNHDLIVKVKGSNVLQTEGSATLVAQDGNLLIQGIGANPFLRIEGVGNSMNPNVSAIVLATANKELKFVDVTVDAIARNSQEWAIYVEPNTSKMRVDNANLRASLVDPDGFDRAISKINVLEMANGVAFLTDEAEWPLMKWDDVENFQPVDPSKDKTHVWIGKDPKFPTDIENAFVPVEKAQKVLLNGQIFILRGEHMYDVTGKMVR